jgi:hypothetical protein
MSYAGILDLYTMSLIYINEKTTRVRFDHEQHFADVNEIRNGRCHDNREFYTGGGIDSAPGAMPRPRCTAEYWTLRGSNRHGVAARLGGDRLAAGWILSVIQSAAQIKEDPMINRPEMLRDMEHWADGSLTGAAAASLIAIAGAAVVLLARVT